MFVIKLIFCCIHVVLTFLLQFSSGDEDTLMKLLELKFGKEM